MHFMWPRLVFGTHYLTLSVSVILRLAMDMHIHGYIHGYIHVWISDFSRPVNIYPSIL